MRTETKYTPCNECHPAASVSSLLSQGTSISASTKNLANCIWSIQFAIPDIHQQTEEEILGFVNKKPDTSEH